MQVVKIAYKIYIFTKKNFLTIVRNISIPKIPQRLRV